jgi:hypothetical protein
MKLTATQSRRASLVEIRPAEADFYRKVIEQRVSHKKQNPALTDFLKVLANSGSYGLFVEVNKETKKKRKDCHLSLRRGKGNS